MAASRHRPDWRFLVSSDEARDGEPARPSREGEAARPVHFRGTVRDAGGTPELAFDYRLREGPATSTNALDLLRIVGLGPEAD